MSEKTPQPAAAFAPFFLGAALIAIASIAIWGVVYLFSLPLPLATISAYHWHAHEMLYGYVMAVIAGFLLTAVAGWTGKTVVTRSSLAGLFFLWLLARLLFAAGVVGSAAIFDLLFVAWLSIAVTRPIVRAAQWRQMAVVSKLVLLGVGNLCFYLGASGILAMGAYWGIYGGLYLVLGLIMTMGRRLLPGFIEAQQEGAPVFNSAWLDGGSLLLFLAFFVSELVAKTPMLSASFALGVAVINAIRLLAWYRPCIWKTSLLWSLYFSLWMVVFGFLLFAASYWFGWWRLPAIHAMAMGGIGLVTLSMMSRVTLDYAGSTGTPPALAWAFLFLMLGTLFRVVLPLLWLDYYSFWIVCSVLCWITAFSIFAAFYLPMLRGPGPGRS